MSSSILTADLLRTLPPALQKDERLKNLATVIANELNNTLGMIKQNIIYARIDELSESVIDILAYDLHVDWYDYSYSIETKRAIIKDSIKVHMRMGTKFSIEQVAKNILGDGKVIEWYEYGGKPFHFIIQTEYPEYSEEIDQKFRKQLLTAQRISTILDAIEFIAYSSKVTVYANTTCIGAKITAAGTAVNY